MVSASVTTTVGQNLLSHSDTRYQARAARFHFLRLRSMPSTLSATGTPNSRGHRVKIALAPLQYSATSGRWRSRCHVETAVCAMVSRYLCRIVGRYCRRTPRYRDSACDRSEEHTSELQSLRHLVCRLLLEK